MLHFADPRHCYLNNILFPIIIIILATFFSVSLLFISLFGKPFFYIAVEHIAKTSRSITKINFN